MARKNSFEATFITFTVGEFFNGKSGGKSLHTVPDTKLVYDSLQSNL